MYYWLRIVDRDVLLDWFLGGKASNRLSVRGTTLEKWRSSSSSLRYSIKICSFSCFMFYCLIFIPSLFLCSETHRTVLNQILRQSTTHLADGPFAVLVDHTRVLDFDVKRRYFRSELERLDEGIRRDELAVHVRRNNVFEDSFRELHRRSADEWKNRFYIVFEGKLLAFVVIIKSRSWFCKV